MMGELSKNKDELFMQNMFVGIANKLGGIDNILNWIFKHENMDIFTHKQWKECCQYLQTHNKQINQKKICFPKVCLIVFSFLHCDLAAVYFFCV